MKRKFGSVLLCLCMVLTLLPVSAQAEEPTATHANHCICGKATHANVGDHTSEVKPTDGWQAWNTTNALPTTAGSYYLTDNVTISATWEPASGTFLCLNGKTITCTASDNNSSNESGVDVIKVPSGVTLTITDCQNTAGKITHASGKYGRGVMVNGGTFNLYGGSITGNTPSDTASGGGVYIDGNGTFNMSGGNISGNTTGYRGGGVYVDSGSTFNMSGGKITGNTKKADYAIYGGGVYVSGAFNMSGGEITGNNARNNLDSGGGVYVPSTGTFTVSGTAKVTGNVYGGTKQSNGSITGGTTNNVYLYTGKTITVGGALDNTASIGVTTTTAPTSPNYVVIAKPGTGYTLTNDDKAAFTPDAGTTNYHIVLDTTNKQLKLGAGSAPVHNHSWSYALDGQSTIKATCNAEGCTSPVASGSVTIAAPTELTYSGSEKAATLTNNLPTGVSAPTISYTKGGNAFTGTPTDAGTYTASITLGSATASVSYTITAKSITAGEGDITLSGDTTYTGSQIKPTVTVKDGDTPIPASEYTVEYSNNINAGTATVTITDKTGGNYTLTTVTQNFTINKATYTPADASGSAKFGESGTVDLTSLIVSGGTASYQSVTSGSDLLNGDPSIAEDGKTLNFAFKSDATSGQTATITVSVTGCDNYDNYTITVTVTVSDAAPTPPSTPSVPSGGSSSSSVPTVTVPVSSDAGSVNVRAEVSRGTATVAISDRQIESIAASGSGTVTVDVSDVKNVNSVKLPAQVVETTNKAEGTGLTVALPAGSVTLDETALESVSEGSDGKAVTVSVVSVPTSALPTTVKEVIGMEPSVVAVVDVNITAGSTRHSGFDGGRLTISIPYTPKAGEDTSKLTVWFIRDDGTIENKGGHYDAEKKCFTFVTDHLSQYLLVNTNDLIDFSDVAADAYYAAAVNWAVSQNITDGIGGGKFGPDLACTRAQIVTFLYRCAVVNGVDVSVGEDTNILSYSDALEIPEYAIEAFQWACGAGIIQGSDGKLMPNDDCTRAQIVTMLYRYAVSVGNDVSVGEDTNILSYTDFASVPEYAVAPFQWACGANIIQGADGKLMPNDTCTRAQIVTMLYRANG